MLQKMKIPSSERILFLLGSVLLAVSGGVWADRIIFSHTALLNFRQVNQSQTQAPLRPYTIALPVPSWISPSGRRITAGALIVRATLPSGSNEPRLPAINITPIRDRRDSHRQ